MLDIYLLYSGFKFFYQIYKTEIQMRTDRNRKTILWGVWSNTLSCQHFLHYWYKTNCFVQFNFWKSWKDNMSPAVMVFQSHLVRSSSLEILINLVKSSLSLSLSQDGKDVLFILTRSLEAQSPRQIYFSSLYLQAACGQSWASKEHF